MQATMFSKKSNCKVYFLIWLVGTTPTIVATLCYCSWLLITKHSPVIYIYISSLRIMGSQTCWFGDPNKNPAKNRVKTPLFWRVCPMILRDKHISQWNQPSAIKTKETAEIIVFPVVGLPSAFQCACATPGWGLCRSEKIHGKLLACKLETAGSDRNYLPLYIIHV